MKREQAAFAKRLNDALRNARIEASPKTLEGLLARYGGAPVTPQAISGWLHGKYLPRHANMQALAKIVGLQVHELRDGKPARGISEPRFPDPTGSISGTDSLAIKEFLSLPAKQRALVRELIGSLIAARHEK